MTARQRLVLVVAACTMCATAGAAFADIATQFDAKSGTTASNGNTIGWRFGVTTDISVTQLGCLNGVYTPDAGDDSRAGVTHEVGIYSETTQALLASAVVTNGAAGR